MGYDNADRPTVEAPEGYVLIPKGGAPKKILRDIAIYMARLIKLGEFGNKGYLADDWLIKYFELTDDSHLRKSRKKAKKVVTRWWTLIGVGGDAIWLFPTKKTADNLPYVEAGTVGWFWMEGLDKAVEAKAIENTLVPSPGDLDGRQLWETVTSKHGC